MNRRRYGFDIYQESEKDIDIDDEGFGRKKSHHYDDDEDEDDNKKKKDDDKFDMDLDEDNEDEKEDNPKKKKRNKNADIDDEEDDEDEIHCNKKSKCKSMRDKKDDNDDADIDFDDIGSDDELDDEDDDGEEDKPKKKKQKRDTDIEDDEDKDDDEEKYEDEDDGDEMDIEIEEECGNGCSTTQFKEYVANKFRRNRNLDIVLEGGDTGDLDTSSGTDSDESIPGDVDEGGSNEGPDNETSTNFSTESAKAKRKKKKNDNDFDMDLNEEDDEDKEDEDEETDEDEENDDVSDDEDESPKKSKSKKNKKIDHDFEEESFHPTTASSVFNKPGAIEHSDKFSEYTISLIEQAELRSERQIMKSLIDELYKEYAIESVCEYYFYDEEDDETETEGNEAYDEEEVVQERYLGGTGKDIVGYVKPIAKLGKKMNEKKHEVAKKGLIRNTFHLTNYDLKKGGIIYKLITWPFLLIKNFIRTILHKVKAFSAYTSALRAIEIKVNREVTHLKKNVHNLPKVASAAGVGYTATSAAAISKGEPLPLNPIEFISTEGAKLIESLGKDSMLRGLTYKLATAFEEGSEKIAEVLKEHNETKSQQKVTPEMADDSRNILDVSKGKACMNGVINMNGIDQLMKDIDTWGNLTEKILDVVQDHDESTIKECANEMEKIESRYLDHDKLKTDMIFNEKGGAVKISDFYEELSVKLAEKVRQLENGLKNINEIESVIKQNAEQFSDSIKKTLTELNASSQHTCNAFMEIIDTIDDLGKYMMNTMKQYLNCLEQTSTQISNKSNPIESNKNEPKKHHKLFEKNRIDEEEE